MKPGGRCTRPLEKINQKSINRSMQRSIFSLLDRLLHSLSQRCKTTQPFPKLLTTQPFPKLLTTCAAFSKTAKGGNLFQSCASLLVHTFLKVCAGQMANLSQSSYSSHPAPLAWLAWTWSGIDVPGSYTLVPLCWTTLLQTHPLILNG